MRFLNNVKIRGKLTFMILFMLVGIGAMGVVGYVYNQKATDSATSLYDENMVSVVGLSDARTQSRANFANILNLMVSRTEEERVTIMENYNKRLTAITDDFTNFKAGMAEGFETTQYNLIMTNTDAWNSLCTQLIELIQDGKTEDAIAEFKDKAETVFEDLQTSVRDLVNYKIEEAAAIHEQNLADSKKMSGILIGTAAGILLLCVVFGILITISITRPVRKIVSLIEKTSQLDFMYDKSYEELLTHKEEMGAIANALARMRVVFREVVGSIQKASDMLTSSSENLAASTSETERTLGQVVNAVHEIAEGNSSQAGLLSHTSEAIGFMTRDIESVNSASVENSVNAKRSIELIGEGRKAIDITIVKMNENIKVSNAVDKAVNDLSVQMNKVGEIVDVIRQISEQTNLLALNASIEAARAGIAGRGFAVVASEIGKLAVDTNRAVDEIAEIVDAAIDKNKRTSDKMDQVRTIVGQQEEAIDVTMGAFEKINDAVKNIADHTMDISDKIKHIAEEAKKISDQAQDLAAVSEETAAGSEEISAGNQEQMAVVATISSAAGQLSDMANTLNLEVAKFKI